MSRSNITDHKERSVFSSEFAAAHDFFRGPIVYSHDLSKLIDYQIAQDADTSLPIFFGSQNPQGVFPYLVEDVRSKGVSSQYYNSVLCPLHGAIDRSGDGGIWEPYKNMAFWAGGMDANRSFILITNIAWYYNKGAPNPMSGTCREILWLMANGYTARPDPSNPVHTIFFPSPNPSIFSIISKGDQEEEMGKLKGLIQNILQQRSKLTRSADAGCRSGQDGCYTSGTSSFFNNCRGQSASSEHPAITDVQPAFY